MGKVKAFSRADDDDLDATGIGREPGGMLRQEQADRCRRSDAHRSIVADPGRIRPCLEARHRFGRRRRIRRESKADLGRDQPVGAALEQRQTESRLEGLEPSCDRGLAQPESSRRQSEATAGGDGVEDFKIGPERGLSRGLGIASRWRGRRLAHALNGQR